MEMKRERERRSEAVLCACVWWKDAEWGREDGVTRKKESYPFQRESMQQIVHPMEASQGGRGGREGLGCGEVKVE